MAKSCPFKGSDYDVCSEACMFWDNNKCLIKEYLKVVIKKTKIEIDEKEIQDLRWRDIK